MLTIRTFQRDDAKQIAQLMKKNFLESSIRMYVKNGLEETMDSFTAELVLSLTSKNEIYVALDGEKVIGFGCISVLKKANVEEVVLKVLTAPNLKRFGMRMEIIEALEKLDKVVNAQKISILSVGATCNSFIREKEKTDEKEKTSVA